MSYFFNRENCVICGRLLVTSLSKRARMGAVQFHCGRRGRLICQRVNCREMREHVLDSHVMVEQQDYDYAPIRLEAGNIVEITELPFCILLAVELVDGTVTVVDSAHYRV